MRQPRRGGRCRPRSLDAWPGDTPGAHQSLRVRAGRAGTRGAATGLGQVRRMSARGMRLPGARCAALARVQRRRRGHRGADGGVMSHAHLRSVVGLPCRPARVTDLRDSRSVGMVVLRRQNCDSVGAAGRTPSWPRGPLSRGVRDAGLATYRPGHQVCQCSLDQMAREA